MTRGRWRNGNTAAAFSSLPRCASRPPTAPDASACCATLARPPFALERLRQLDGEQLSYDHPKSGPGGSGPQILTPLKLLDRLAAVVPPPRVHRHRYFGVLAPNSPRRSAVTALARKNIHMAFCKSPTA
jgi:hypothetical protein